MRQFRGRSFLERLQIDRLAQQPLLEGKFLGIRVAVRNLTVENTGAAFLD
jgi:hypothetical protein